MDVRRDNFEPLADELLDAWQTAHGSLNGQARVLRGPERLVVLIERAFSPAERFLAQDPLGEALLQRYARALISLIGDEIKERFSTALGCPVLESDIIAHPESGQVLFLISLAGGPEHRSR